MRYRYLFGQLVREEWRLHSHLFGGHRFALFPVFVALVAAGTTTFLALAGTDPATVVLGLHLLVLVAGLHVGTVGLVGRDALEDLLGDTTLLLYSARTLPVSLERLLVAFLAKDVAYYALLFVGPLVVGLLPLVALAGLDPRSVPLLAVTAGWTFAIGVSVSLGLVGVYTKSRSTVALLAIAVGLAVALRGGAALALTPYQLTVQPTPQAAVASLLATVVPAGVGVYAFEFGSQSPTRTAPDRFRDLRARLGSRDPAGVVTKSLLDVHRSSGGIWKVVFSQGLVFVVLAVLLVSLPRVVPVQPSPGLTLAAILALGTFTTYNWLCQFEDERFYMRYPVSLAAVFRGKFYAFLVLALPVGLGYLAIGAIVFGAGTAILGVLTFVPLSVYVFGVTAYVAGLQPNELLFDTPTFAAFTVAAAVVLVPTVVAAIAFPLAPGWLSVLVLALAGSAGVLGVGLHRRTGPRWSRETRAG